MWEYCGMARNEAGLIKAKGLIQQLKIDFWKNAIVVGKNEELNMSLEKAGRVADFIELGELMIDDALNRKESCGGHFREESQTEEGEALRDDENYAYVAAWEFTGENMPEQLNKEPLVYENVKLTQRSYK
jgi:succinate dehydrogenase / fumarate reductase flavoprotein subunit